MKKVFLFVSVLAFLLVGCTSSSQGEPSQQQSEAVNSPVPTEAVQESDPVEPSVEPETPENAATLGDYYVEIKSAALTEDYEGKPVLVVTYSWTNNSDDTTSAMVSVSCSAFQDGVGLETAIVMDDTVYDSDAFMTEVRPGTTIDVQAAFILSNTESIVEVEVGEWLTFDSDPPVAYTTFNPTEL